MEQFPDRSTACVNAAVVRPVSFISKHLLHFEMSPGKPPAYNSCVAVICGHDRSACSLLLFIVETSDEQQTHSGRGRPHQWTGCSVPTRVGNRPDVKSRGVSASRSSRKSRVLDW